MKIFSPVPYGSGAQIVHQCLASHIPDYQVKTYHPYLTLLPPLLWTFRDKSADIVHAPVDYACFSRHGDTPLVSTVHGFMLDDEVSSSSSMIRKIHYKTDLKYFYKKSLSISKKVVCVSHYLKNKIISELNHQGNIEVIHNGIDTDNFKPLGTNKSENKIILLFVGNLRKAKGTHILPALLDQLGNKYKLLYTSGMKNNRTVIRHNNAHCVGSVSHNEMPELYNSADILICPSIREGFGLGIAEAMACGLPVVATNCSAIPELIIDGEGGYLCEPDDVNHFSERINTLANSHVLRKEMGAFNRATAVEKFHVDLMVNKYKLLFEEVLSE